MKDIQIEQKEIKVVTKIIIDGKNYPITLWNRKKADLYLSTKDEKYLEQLTDFSLDLGASL